MLKLLITGANGQVGSEVVKEASQAKLTTIGLSHEMLDITNTQQITEVLLQQRPHFVINCAAYTAVDQCEQEKERATTINALGPKLLAHACGEQNIPLLHLSTDYVFSGKQQSPYGEKDGIEPLNFYGESKLAGENFIREHWHKHIILRVSSVFSSHHTNFVKTILRLAHEKETLRIVADQKSCPTAATDIALTLIQICQQLNNRSTENLWGTYHYCGTPLISWYDFATTIIDLAHPQTNLIIQNLEPINTSDYKTPAKRPTYSALNCEKIANTFSILQPEWLPPLEKTVSKLCNQP